MTTTAAPSRERGRLLGILLLLAAAAGGVALWRRADPRPARPEARALVLDEAVVLTSATPLTRRLRVAGPAVLTVEAAGAPKGTVFALGPAAPIEKGEAPDPARETTWETGGETAPRALPVYGTGLYLLRLTAPAGSPDAHVRLRITRAPGP